MSQNTINVTDSNFESSVLKSNVPVLVDFWAPWCGPCVAIGPVLENLAAEFSGKLVVAKMNVDENANTPAQFGVRSIPFMVIVKNGKVIDSVVGAVPKAKLSDMITKAIG
ncbi:MAG: thioredoxin [Proteobacteria bacterium]|jgi:thioredoxin 1|nr:thioredoxin [Pseudomonadota bacterium]